MRSFKMAGMRECERQECVVWNVVTFVLDLFGMRESLDESV